MIIGVRSLANRLSHRRVLAMIAVGLLLVIGFAAGWSRSAGADPGNDRSRNVTPAEAAAILGGPLPDVEYTPLGLHRTAILANPLNLPQNLVTIAYAIHEPRADVQLTVLKAPSITQADDGVVETQLGGHPVQVLTKTGHNAQNGTWTFLDYTWSARGLSFSLTVHLLDGLDRGEADKIAASIE